MILTPLISRMLTGRRKIAVLGIFVLWMLIPFEGFAQSFRLGTACGGGDDFGGGNGYYSTYAMNDRGAFWQKRIQENFTTNAGSRKWEFYEGDYFNSWRAPSSTAINIAGHNQVIPANAATASAFWRDNYLGGDGARLLSTTNGYFYTFNIQEKGYANSYMAVLETAYDPKTISVSDAVAPYGGRTATVTLSAAPAAGEYVYIRYTTNDYATSTIIPVSFIGNVGTAIVPVPSNSGVTQKYYAYSSPKTKAEIDAQVVTYGQAAHDMLTLELSNGVQNDFNFQVVVTSSGGSTLMNTYQTIQAAFTAINGGTNHTGVITIALIGNTTETASAVLNASGTGSASYTSLGVQPAGGSPRTISGSLAAPLINLNGADNVTIDGREGGTGSTKLLTISNTSTNAAATSILLTNDAQGNTLRYCTFKGRAAGSASSGVVVIDAAGGTSGNDNLLIDRCDVDATASALNCIYANGTATAINNSVTVSNCNLYDYRGDASAGINMAAYNQDWTIAYNSFYQTTAYAGIAGVTYGIYIGANGASSNTLIYNNFIGGSGANCAGTWTINTTLTFRFVGMYLNFSSIAGSKVYNNTLGGFSWLTSLGLATAPGLWSGIYVVSGSVNVGTDGANIIGSSTGAGNITVTLNSGNRASAVFGIGTEASSINSLKIENNSIGSITALLGGSITNSVISIYPVYVRNSTGTCSINNNLIGSSTTPNSINAAAPSNTSLAQTVTGIFSSTTGNISITNNSISNLSNANVTPDASNGLNRGIQVTSSTGTVIITGNLVSDITASQPMTGTGVASNIIGISMEASGAAGVTLAGNTIYNLKNTDGAASVNVLGLYNNGPAAGTNSVSKNFIHSLSVSSSSLTANVYGMRINAGTTTYSNNIISLGTTITNGNAIYGIFENGAAGTTNSLYHNTVYIGGSTSGNANTFSLYSNSTANTRNFRNNVFVNTRSRTAGTSAHYAAWFNYISSTNLTLQYNNYYTPGTGGILGRFNNLDVNSVPLISGKDLNSNANNPQLTNAGSIIAADYKPIAPSGGENSTGIATDFAGAPRNCAFTMGAFEVEVTVGTPVFNLGSVSTSCQGAATVTYTATATASTGFTYSLDAASFAAGNTINTATGAVTYISGWLGPSVITAVAAGCNGPSAPATHTVTITAAPAAPTGNSPQVLCTGQTVAALTVTTGTNILWYAAASGGSALAASTVLGNTTYYASQTVGGCESVDRLPVTVQLVVNTPVSVITGNQTPCPNTTGLVYSVINIPGTTYTWTVPPGWSVASGQGSSSVTITSGSTGQNGIITVSAVNTCGTTTSSLAVSTTAPDASIVPDYCIEPGKIRLTALPGPSGYTYQWLKDGVNLSTNQEITVTEAAIYTVIVKNAAGCTGSASITLSTELVIDGNFENFNPASISFLSDYTYKPDLTGVNNELYPEKTYGVGPDPQLYHNLFWGRDHTSGSGNFMIINGSPLSVAWKQTITGLSPNTDYYFSAWGISLNSTENTNNAQLQFRINTVNVGNIVNLLDRKESNDPPFNWRRFYGVWNSGAATSATLEIVDLQDAAGGNDFGLDDISFGTLVPTFMSLNALANDGGPVCEGGILNLSVEINGGRPPYTFEWKNPSGTIISTAQYPSIPNVSPANNGVYTVVIHDSYGCAPVMASTAFITVNPTPTGSIIGGASVCLNEPVLPKVTFSGSGSTEPYTFTYKINIGPELTVTTTSGSSVSVDVPTNVAGNFTYTLTKIAGSTGCVRTLALPQAVTFTVRGVNAALSSSAASICEGQAPPTVTFTGSGTGTGIGPPYTFTYTLNGVAQTPLTTALGNSSISVSVPAPAGTYVYSLTSVSASGCTQAASGSIIVTVNTRPVINLNGPTSICGIPNPGKIYTTDAGMINYTWAVSAGGTITSGTTGNSVTVTWTAVGIPTISVNYTGSNGCAAISPKILEVGVNTGAPAPPSAIPFTNQDVCAPATGIVYNVNYIAGVTYTWSYTGAGATINDQGKNSITIDFAANATNGTLSVFASNACSPPNSAASNLDIYISTPRVANAGPDQTVCSSSPVTLAGSYSSGSGTPTVQWSGGTGSFAPNSSTLNAVYTPSAAEISSGTVTLTLSVTSGTCTTPSTDQMIITINQAATVNAGVNQTMCVSDTITLSGSIGGSATSATWSSSPGLGVSFIPNATTLSAKFTTSTATTKTLTLTTNDPPGICPAATSQIVITVNPKPTISGVISVCVGSTIQLTGSPTAAVSNAWISATPSVATVNTTGLVSGVTSGSTIITYTNTNGCQNNVTIAVNSLSILTAGSNSAVCEGSTINLNGGPAGMSSYSWIGPNGYTSNPLSTSVTSNFDGMGVAAGTTLPAGFKIGANWSSGTTVTNFAYGTSGAGIVTSSSTGGTINWANGVTASSTDRALGFLNSSTFSSPRSIMYAFTNTTGNTINTINISWNYEKYRSGSSVCTWNFYHGNTSTATTAATAGDQVYTADADNTVVYNPPTAIAKSFSISGLSIPNGATYYLRWTLTAASAPNGQGLGIDDFTLNYITGGTQNPTIPNATLAMEGTYTLTAVNSNGCSSTASTAVVIANQWTGTTNSNWDVPANWSCGVPGSSTHVIIPNVTNKPVVNITNAACNNLTINASSSLTIDAGKALTINGNVTNNGTFTIKTDALDNNGSLIVEGSSTGNVTYNRYLTPTGTPPGRWFIASSPVNTSSGGFDGSNIIRNGTTDYDFAPYIEPFNEGWRYQVALPTSLNNGQGYLARVGATPYITFTGPLNSSPVLVPVTNSPSSPGVYDNGWNAVGNPFTSAIGITSGTTTQNFLAVNDGILETGYKAIYLWYQTLPVTDQNFRVINNVGYTGNQYGGINLDNYVQAGQGFLVNVNANGNIIFTKGTTGMQVHRPASTTYKSARTSWPGITLLAGSNGRTRNTVVAFDQNMTTGLDPSYDAGLLAASDFNLYTRLVDGSSETDFTIQCLPDAMYETYAVPVGIDMPQPGKLTFKASGVILPEGLYPVIEDRLLQVSTPLKSETDSLTVDIPEATWGPGRFYLRFSENAIHTGTITPKPVTKYTATYSDRKIILFGTPEADSRAWLYDVNGRLLGSEYRLTSANRNEIPVPGLSAGIYLLKIEGKTTRQTLKITVLNQ